MEILPWRCRESKGEGKDGCPIGMTVEICSCYVHGEYGDLGQQCGRCVLLAKGEKCCDPPAHLYVPSRQLIPKIRQLNGYYVDNPNLTWDIVPGRDSGLWLCGGGSLEFVADYGFSSVMDSCQEV